MLGLPAITVPVGMVPTTHAAPAAASAGGAGSTPVPPMLPVGLQIMGPCWHEASLLQAAAVLEAAVAAAGSAPPLPPVWYDVLAPRPSRPSVEENA